MDYGVLSRGKGVKLSSITFMESWREEYGIFLSIEVVEVPWSRFR